jgi:hypothetical protein
MRDRRGAYRVLVERPVRKTPLGRQGRRWKDNIKIDIQQAILGGMDWIAVAKHRDGWRTLVNAVINLRVP